jgi:hypothetical protein
MNDAYAHAMQVHLCKDNTWGVTTLLLKRILSRDSGRKIFKGREACYPLSTLTIVMSYIASSNKEAKLVKATF